ncbi:MAG TPA: DUF3786 domain-containing protein [Methanomassiliicoccales archaeon]|nr:DUF3786 domain-containing protein [Methanomassiliicoccales archaeon]
MICNPADGQATVLAWKALEGISPRDLAKSSGASLQSDDISLPTLGSTILVSMTDQKVTVPPELSGGWGLIALHHLRGCQDWKRDDEWMSFEQLKGASPFATAFRQRAVTPLASRFGNMPKELSKVGRPLGGRSLKMGDAAALFYVFPRLRLAAIVWQGDEDVPPGANMLFDKGGAGTLPAEDLAELGICLCQMLVSKDR